MSTSTPNSPYIGLARRWSFGYKILGGGGDSLTPTPLAAPVVGMVSSSGGVVGSVSGATSPCQSPLLRRVQLARLRHLLLPKMRISPLQMDASDESDLSSGHYETLEFVSSVNNPSTLSPTGHISSASHPNNTSISPGNNNYHHNFNSSVLRSGVSALLGKENQALERSISAPCSPRPIQSTVSRSHVTNVSNQSGISPVNSMASPRRTNRFHHNLTKQKVTSRSSIHQSTPTPVPSLSPTPTPKSNGGTANLPTSTTTTTALVTNDNNNYYKEQDPYVNHSAIYSQIRASHRVGSPLPHPSPSRNHSDDTSGGYALYPADSPANRFPPPYPLTNSVIDLYPGTPPLSPHPGLFRMSCPSPAPMVSDLISCRSPSSPHWCGRAVSCSTPPLPPDDFGEPPTVPFTHPVATTYPFQEVREVSVGRHEEEKFGMKVDHIGDSLYITMILKSSTAAKAGLKVGDEVVRINDKPVNRIPLDEILGIIRNCETSVKIAYKPRAVIARVRDVILKKVDGRVGIRLQRRSDGLFIDVVVDESPAIKAGLKEGDELLRINDRVVIDWSQERATRHLKDLPDNTDVVLYIREMLPMAHVAGSRTLCYPPPPPSSSLLSQRSLPPLNGRSVSPSRTYCTSPTPPGGHNGIGPASEPGSPLFNTSRSTLLNRPFSISRLLSLPGSSQGGESPLSSRISLNRFLRPYRSEVSQLSPITDKENLLDLKHSSDFHCSETSFL